MSTIKAELRHPVTFILFTTLAVFATRAILLYAFKRAGWSGPAAFFQ